MKNFIEKYFDESNSFSWRMSLVMYSMMFASVMLFALVMFSAYGMGPFQFKIDGFTYFGRIAYIGEYIRSILGNFFINKTLPFHFYDFRIGVGDDILNFLWVGALNPLVFLTAPLFTVEHTELSYWLICVLHMYVAGLSFMLFCSYKKSDSTAAACGAVAYVFSGFALFYFLKHFHFITAMIILPAMFWTIEKILHGEEFYTLALITAASLLINFYFTFMITIMLFIYATVRFFDIYERDRFSMFCRLFCNGTTGYLLGMMLAAPFFLPIIVKFIDNARGNAGLALSEGIWHYSVPHMLHSILYLFSPGGTWGIGASMLPICFIAMICFFREKISFNRGLKIFLLLFLIGSFFPALTYIFTIGSGAPSDKRWSFVFPFAFSYILVLMFPRLVEWQEEDESYCLIAILFYSILSLCLHLFNLYDINKNIFFSLVATFLTAISLNYAKRYWKIALRKAFLALLVVFFSMANVSFLYFASPVKFKDTFGQANEAYNVYNENMLPYIAIDEIEPQRRFSFFRSHATSERGIYFSLLARQYDLNSYGSLITKYPSYLLGMENRAAYFLWMAHGCDDIAALESLFSVKYFAAENGKEAFIPYGFTKVKSAQGCSVFENSYFLPLGYTYDSYITHQEYKKYSALEKQEAQLQTVSLEKGVSGFKQNTAVAFISKPIQYKITRTDGLEWKNRVLKINKRNAEMEIRFVSTSPMETYLRIQGLNVNDSLGTPSFFSVVVAGLKWKKFFVVAKNSDSRYHGGENFLIRLGTDNITSERCVKIIWTAKGTFKLDDIQVYAQPMDNYPAQINKLREDVLENIYVGNDRVSGTISLQKNKILCLSIPYSKGWHAKVDGKKAELLKANSLFMALPLEAGDHKIELEYHVPGLRLGLCFFVFGVFILAGIIRCDKKRDKFKNGNR
ncbi:MAG: YfhO family protein [bacterium]|nr:YfhO family protein [bacterium]